MMKYRAWKASSLLLALALGLFSALGGTALADEDENIATFNYTGGVQTFTAPADGYYKLEAWGAQGGTTWNNYTGGLGGYATGVIHLAEGTVLRVYVGGAGGYSGDGWNGGGTGMVGTNTYSGSGSAYQGQLGCGGGGATDFRISGDTLYHRVLVAGGGGGGVRFGRGWWNNLWSYTGANGGAGGGTSGAQGSSGSDVNAGGGGATQTAGGAGGPDQASAGNPGSFGQGGNTHGGDAPGAAGGGGWFGGGSGGSGYTAGAKNKATSGGGGSGFAFTGGTPIDGYQVPAEFALTSVSMTNGVRSNSGQARVTRLAWNATYDGNGGTSSRAVCKAYVTRIEDESTYAADFTIPAETGEQPDVTRENFAFTGWNTESDGTGAGGGTTLKLTSDIVLYAQWRLVPFDSQKPAPRVLTYTGEEQELLDAPTAALPDGFTMYYALTKTDAPPTDDQYTTSIPSAVETGTYYVWYKAVGDGTHNGTEPVYVTSVINRADISPVVTLADWTYGEAAGTPVVGGNPGNGAVTYVYKGTSYGGVDYDSADAPVSAGKYTVTATVAQTANYNGGTVSADFIVHKATAYPPTDPQKPTARTSLIETGAPQELIAAPAEIPDGYTILYSIDGGTSWDAAIPTAADMGNYTVKVRYVPDDNHFGFTGEDIPVAILGEQDIPSSELRVVLKPSGIDARAYTIILTTADSRPIQRFASAELVFRLTEPVPGNGRISYRDGVSANSADCIRVDGAFRSAGRFKFYVKGQNGASEISDLTADSITLGTVQFGGYGMGWRFEITKAVISTVADTFTSEMIPAMLNTAAGTTADAPTAKIDPLSIQPVAKDLTVHVTFPNQISDNDWQYQDMTLIVSGGDLMENITVKLGNAANQVSGGVTAGEYPYTADARVTATPLAKGVVHTYYTAASVEAARFTVNRYTVELRQILSQGMWYTVTVSGAGYRTARYSMLIDDDKTLTFWNNVMDEPILVESGRDSSAVNITYLAGDIVQDAQINIYDLSAVVSYFGRRVSDADAGRVSPYARYDLNRDGEINAVDIAYILTSWGK